MKNEPSFYERPAGLLRNINAGKACDLGAYPNEPGRFGVRSKDPITFNSDGSLDVFSGPSRPEGCPESNWIPTVDSSLDFLIRLYSPAEKFTEGQWTPPVIERVS